MLGLGLGLGRARASMATFWLCDFHVMFPGADLRWNNLGVLGGRKLLGALRNNSSLVKLRLEGNGIPSDITDAIGQFTTPSTPCILALCK